MFKISYDKKITMVQGDTGVIRMRIHNYELSQGDEVRFAIVNKANPSILLCQHSDKKIVLEKQVTVFEKDGSARIIIYPYDTEYLQPGKYLYEIQVKTKDGRIDTVVPLTGFTLMDGSIQGEFGQTTPSKPEPTPSEIELRFKRLENEIIPELGNRITNVENEVDSISSSLDNITQDTSVVITVGNNGDYKTINEAIAYLSRKKLKYNNSGFKAEILLKSGFTISEQIFVKNIDLGFITISSEDEVVKADCTNFKQNVYEEPYGDSGYPVNSASILTGYGNAVIPNINILVDMQNTTSAQAGTSGICLIYGATGRIERKKGFINSGSTGVFILEGSRLYATDTIIKDSFGNNISCFRGSYILFRGGVATGSKTGYGVYLDNACIGDFVSSNLSENNESGAWVSGLSLLSANRSIVNNNGRNGVSADNSSIIDIHNATIIGNEQSGIECNSSRVSANNSTITNNGVRNITVSNGGIVDAQKSNLTNSLGANSVYVNYGGILNISKSNAQKVDGVNGKDIRVGYGGIIYAHGAIGGYSGSAPNSLSKNGIIFNESDNLTSYGKVGRVKNKMIWSTIKNGCVASSLFPIDYVTQKNITIQIINIHESGSLTSEEIALVKVEKLTDGVCFLVNDNSLANKLSGCATNITLLVTLIDEEDV